MATLNCRNGSGTLFVTSIERALAFSTTGTSMDGLSTDMVSTGIDCYEVWVGLIEAGT